MASVFAERAARIVAASTVAEVTGARIPALRRSRPLAAPCWVRARVEVNFLKGPTLWNLRRTLLPHRIREPRVRIGPSVGMVWR